LDAWFPSEKVGRSAGAFGEVELMPDGLGVRPPATLAKHLVFLALGILNTPRGKFFLIPYASVTNLRILETKTFVGIKRPIIEIEFLDQKEGVSRTLAFAPCEGKLKVKYKTAEFYDELMSKISVSKRTS